MKHALDWFEVPVVDFQRAKKFYEAIFDVHMQTLDLGNLKMGFFPSDPEGIGGTICWGEWYKPSADGTLVYLNGNPDLNDVLQRVDKAGGKILVQKKQISPDHGYMAVFVDTEGNRLALHSRS